MLAKREGLARGAIRAGQIDLVFERDSLTKNAVLCHARGAFTDAGHRTVDSVNDIHDQLLVERLVAGGRAFVK
jgi:hypothetical protein